MKNKKAVITMVLTLATLAMATPVFAAASNPDITTGLGNVDSGTLANKILSIGIGVGALSGVVAAFMLIFLGFKLKTGKEDTRAKTKEHIMYVFIGMGVVALSVVIVGFAAYLIKGAA